MIESLCDQACRRVGDLRDAIERGENREVLAELAKESEQLADASARAVAAMVALVRTGESSQRAKRTRTAWNEAKELEAVKRVFK